MYSLRAFPHGRARCVHIPDCDALPQAALLLRMGPRVQFSHFPQEIHIFRGRRRTDAFPFPPQAPPFLPGGAPPPYRGQRGRRRGGTPGLPHPRALPEAGAPPSVAIAATTASTAGCMRRRAAPVFVLALVLCWRLVVQWDLLCTAVI